MCIRDSNNYFVLAPNLDTASATTGVEVNQELLRHTPPVSYTHLDVYKRQLADVGGDGLKEAAVVEKDLAASGAAGQLRKVVDQADARGKAVQHA